MTHQRKVIRDEIVKRLTNRTLAKDKVTANLAVNPWVEELPIIAVYTRSEDATEYAHAPRELMRSLFVVIECIAAESKDSFLSDVLDQLSLEVEDILGEFEDGEVNDCLFEDIILTATEFQYNEEGGYSTGSVRLIYNVKYITAVPKELQATDDFEGVNVKYDLGPEPDGVIEAEDKIDIGE